MEPPESTRRRGAGAWRHVVRWHAAESCPMPKSSRPTLLRGGWENSCELIRSRYNPLVQIPVRTRPAGSCQSHQANSGELPAGAEHGISEPVRSAVAARRPYAEMDKTRTPAKNHSPVRTADEAAAKHPHLANQGRNRRHGHENQPSPSSRPASASRIPTLSANRRWGLHQPVRQHAWRLEDERRTTRLRCDSTVPGEYRRTAQDPATYWCLARPSGVMGASLPLPNSSSRYIPSGGPRRAGLGRDSIETSGRHVVSVDTQSPQRRPQRRRIRGDHRLVQLRLEVLDGLHCA